MGWASVEPAPLTVPLAELPEVDEPVLPLLLLPHAATPIARAAVSGTTASHWRDFTAAPSFGCVVAARLAFPGEESVTEVWQGCEKDVNARSHGFHGICTGVESRCATMLV